MGRTVQLKKKEVFVQDYPNGWVEASHLGIRESELEVELENGDVVLKTLYIGLDPYHRLLMDAEGHGEAFPPSYKPGQTMGGRIVAEVHESENPAFQKGDCVATAGSWATYVVVKQGSQMMKIDPAAVPPSYYLGVLGAPGLTAYFGFLEICRPRPQDEVYVSAAAGAVGQIVGQLAKLEGCRVVGSTGSAEKVKELKETLGFDEAFNYKEEVVGDALKKYFPKGIDIYFDLVGGKTLDAALGNVKPRARVAACGMISQYNLEKPEPVDNLINIVTYEVMMEGFLATRYVHRFPEFVEKMGALVKQQKVKTLEEVTEGIENLPDAFVRMLRGDKVGKAVVKVA